MSTSSESWAIGPFIKHPEPLLRPDAGLKFHCPVLGEEVAWANAAVFNPAAVVCDGRVAMLLRAEGHLGEFNDGCRIGLAWSDDGISFRVEPEPVLFRDHDGMKDYEWPLGCEDPRVTRRDDGLWVMTYTAYDTRTARLCVASSRDLRTWTKHGLAFRDHRGGAYENFWSKSGAIVSRREGDQLIATRVGGRYWMYFGEGVLFAATSDDLLSWEPVEYVAGQNRISFVNENRVWHRVSYAPGEPVPMPIAHPRRGRYDDILVEPGPPALLTDDGIVLIYNGNWAPSRGGQGYTGGQMLLDPTDPTAVIGRCAEPFLVPERPEEKGGVTGDVCFVEGLVPFRDRWFLYYGGADSVILAATAPLAS